MTSGKGKTLLAWSLLVAIPFCGFFLQFRIDGICSDIANLMAITREKGDPEPLAQAITDWDSCQRLLSALITHEEIDAVTQSLHRSQAFLHVGNMEEFYAAINEALTDLDVVRNFDRLTIRSIF